MGCNRVNSIDADPFNLNIFGVVALYNVQQQLNILVIIIGELFLDVEDNAN